MEFLMKVFMQSVYEALFFFFGQKKWRGTTLHKGGGGLGFTQTGVWSGYDLEGDTRKPHLFTNDTCSTYRSVPLRWLQWCTYCRCLRKHWKCHFLKIELNNWLLHRLQESIKVSLVAASAEQLIYLFLTRSCLMLILPITLQRHPCPLGSQKYFNKDRCIYPCPLGRQKYFNKDRCICQTGMHLEID